MPEPTPAANGPLALLICGGATCLLVGGFVAVAALIITIFVRSARRVRQPLAPWTEASLSDLSFRAATNWSRTFGNLSLKGQILPASSFEAAGLVAFTVNVRGQWTAPRGRLQAKTTAQVIDYAIAGEGVGLAVDGSPFGSLRPDGSLVDPAGRVLGRAPRPGGQPFLPSRKGLTEPGYGEDHYPVILGGRAVATIANPVGREGDRFRREKGSAAPAVTLLDRLAGAEAIWVLALAVLQIVAFNLPGTSSAMSPVTGVP